MEHVPGVHTCPADNPDCSAVCCRAKTACPACDFSQGLIPTTDVWCDGQSVRGDSMPAAVH
jgi:hypothetical protein